LPFASLREIQGITIVNNNGMGKKTLVLGASANPARYSYLAINRLRNNDHPVVAIGKRAGEVAGTSIETAPREITDVDTVTLYLNPENQKQYYDYILSLNPKRIIFNPGAENEELQHLAEQKGINTMEACTLVLLSTGQY
jgi:predicted CoA-binding protein